MQNAGKFKGGVRIGPKGSKLKKQFGVAPAQLTELSIIAQTLGFINDEEKDRVSMRMMTQKVLATQVSSFCWSCRCICMLKAAAGKPHLVGNA